MKHSMRGMAAALCFAASAQAAQAADHLLKLQVVTVCLPDGKAQVAVPLSLTAPVADEAGYAVRHRVFGAIEGRARALLLEYAARPGFLASARSGIATAWISLRLKEFTQGAATGAAIIGLQMKLQDQVIVAEGCAPMRGMTDYEAAKDRFLAAGRHGKPSVLGI